MLLASFNYPCPRATCAFYKEKSLHVGPAYPAFGTVSYKEYFNFPLDGMLVHRGVISGIKFAGTIYTPGWREAL